MRAMLSVLLCAVMLLTVVPATVFATQPVNKTEDLRLATLSDLHYYPSVLAPHKEDENYDAFLEKLLLSNVYYEELDHIIDTAFDSLAAEAIGPQGLKYVVLSGDLTINGEKQGHEELAEKLAAFEESSGIKVFVINGNHDINNSKAASYSTVEVERTTPQDFMEIYYDFGFEEAYHTFIDYKSVSDKQTIESQAGMLSYSVQLDGGYRLIMLDAGHYSADVTEDGSDEHETSGGLTKELYEWLLAEIADAKANGETPILNTHWNMSGINYLHEYVLVGFVIDEHYKLQEELADAGLHYAFSGHQHTSDIDITYSDNGEVMYSIVTPTLTEFPAAYRLTEFSYDKQTDSLTATFNTCEINGLPTFELTETYDGPEPYSNTVFKNQFCNADPEAYLMRYIKSFIIPFAGDIVAKGGIIPYIEAMLEINLEQMLNELLKGGIVFADFELFTEKNIMSFLEDLDGQITKLLLKDPEKTCDEVIAPALHELINLQISEVPCTKFINTLGFGSAEQGGTLGDLFMSVMYYMYEGNENISDDAFVTDALRKMTSGEIVKPLVNAIRETIVDDIVLDILLQNLNVNLSAFFVNTDLDVIPEFETFNSLYAFITHLFNNGCFDELVEGEVTFNKVMNAIWNIIKSLPNYSPDTSYLFLANTILEIAKLEYGSSVDEVIDSLLDEYVYADIMIDGIGNMIWKIVAGCVTDDDLDNNVTYVYNGPVAQTPSADEMQLPSHLNVTFGKDSASAFNISWYTKYNVEGTDIELYEATTEPVFKGRKTVPSYAAANCITKAETRSFNGVDIGVIGLMKVERDVYRHAIELTGLKADTTYYYRVGDAKKGLWSETGKLTTASGKTEEFTFLHFTDTQSVYEEQYESWGNLLRDAVEMYPQTAFIAHTGDFVDHGDGFLQWKWGFNTASDSLLNTPIMPTAGNHEAYGSYPLDNYFRFSKETAPIQFTDTGVFYSYDYNNAHIIVLNTNYCKEDGTLSDAQVDWLKEDAAASNADWKIIQMHESVFSNGPHYDESEVAALRSQLLKLMYDMNIDLVLSGHDHVYLRTNFIDHYDLNSGFLTENHETETYTDKNGVSYPMAIDPEGTMFICGGTGGVKTYAPVAPEKINDVYPASFCAYPLEGDYAPENGMFSAITINGTTLTVAACTYDENGELVVFDTSAIQKEKIVYKSGDIDLDKKLTASDARAALRFAVRLDYNTATDFELLAADFDGDGDITATDARYILRCAVMLDTHLIEERSVFKSQLDSRYQ